jgi:uncharacterized protein
MTAAVPVGRVGALLLAPGAGSSSTQPSLLAIEAAVAPLPVARMDFPYRKAGKNVPDKTSILLEAVRSEAAAMVEAAGILPERLLFGGRSMGGRMCSMAVAEGLPAAGLVLISYPLHPPGKAEKLRVEHLVQLNVPCLFIHGTKDPFGSPDELRPWLETIPGPVTVEFLDGKGHDLARSDQRIAELVANWISTLG